MKEDYVNRVVKVKRVQDRIMRLKLEIKGVMLNVFMPQRLDSWKRKRNSGVSWI